MARHNKQWEQATTRLPAWSASLSRGSAGFCIASVCSQAQQDTASRTPEVQAPHRMSHWCTGALTEQGTPSVRVQNAQMYVT